MESTREIIMSKFQHHKYWKRLERSIVKKPILKEALAAKPAIELTQESDQALHLMLVRAKCYFTQSEDTTCFVKVQGIPYNKYDGLRQVGFRLGFFDPAQPGEGILGTYVDYLEKRKQLIEVLEQLSEGLKKGRTEYACSERLSVADFCMVSLSPDI